MTRSATLPRRRIAWIEPGRFPYGYDDQNIYSGVMTPRAGPKMAGLLGDLGYDVEVICGELSPVDVDEISERFDLACVSVLSATAPHGMILGRWLSERGLPVVMGGYQFAHKTIAPGTLAPTEQALDFVPYVIRGEGYRSLPEFLDAVYSGGRLADVSGLSYRTATGQSIHNPNPELLPRAAINALPLADWSVVRDIDRMRVISAHGMHGCPRNCSFCAVCARDGRRNRNLDPARLIDELEAELAAGRFRHVFFSADNLPVLPKWARGVCEEILRRRLKITWTCQGEVGAALREDLVELMCEAGCERWCLGFESINPDSLAGSNKRQSEEMMEAAVRSLHRHGVQIHGMFIVGLPHDTREGVNATVAWAKRMGIQSAQFLCLSDLPGSQDYESQRLWETTFRPFRDAYEPLNWMFVNGHYARVDNDRMSFADVQEATVRAMEAFYSFGRSIGPMLAPRLRTIRASYQRGKGWLSSVRDGLTQSVMTSVLRIRGYAEMRRWDRSEFNRTYRELLTAGGDRAEFLRRKLASFIPDNWRATLDEVYAERQARLGAATGS